MTALHRFLHDTRGSVTIEFVIIFPFVIMLILFILFASTLIATASDVQQLAYELARESVGLNARLTGSETLCGKIDVPFAKTIATETSMLSPARIAGVTCDLNANGYLRVTATYDLLGSTIADLGRQLQMSSISGSIERSATIRP